jgi:hypothetical protein
MEWEMRQNGKVYLVYIFCGYDDLICRQCHQCIMDNIRIFYRTVRLYGGNELINVVY